MAALQIVNLNTLQTTDGNPRSFSFLDGCRFVRRSYSAAGKRIIFQLL